MLQASGAPDISGIIVVLGDCNVNRLFAPLVSAMMALAVATPALAGAVTIAVKSPEGLSIKISTSKSGRTDSVSRNGRFQSGYYLATFSKTAPFYCATVATVGWEIVFPEGATAKRVCFPGNRLKQASIGGKGVLVLTANYQKH